ncbi:unnamed protein product [Rangifer tarandus platyrhynchus]|uniref:Uncharacterized protein n=2 Tax=Rangifer tarandus platyrhynchus TaxID=3082113 RepID=A0ACB0E3K6_RANTA|nr:unnamed protein product [Rangifer tarandus platyrhynchus]CAI9695034.1 unnamed protein product [Rangifer tarandus platyrhynchus]
MLITANGTRPALLKGSASRSRQSPAPPRGCSDSTHAPARRIHTGTLAAAARRKALLECPRTAPGEAEACEREHRIRSSGPLPGGRTPPLPSDRANADLELSTDSRSLVGTRSGSRSAPGGRLGEPLHRGRKEVGAGWA